MKSCLPVAVALLILTASFSSADEFRPMFNGEDFSGWVRTNTPPETWRFEGGLLICSGAPIGEIRTERMYQNFIMELEWRHMVPRGNAGVFVWADDIPSRGVPFHRGIEVQVLENEYGNNRSHTTHGDIFPIHGATMTPVNGRGGSRAFPTEFRSNPSPQWNHYRIECRDGDISLAVNGKVVTQGKNSVPRKGYICLESEGGVVHYRNVKIKELPGGSVPPEQTAIADRGYFSIYTGLNRQGWTSENMEAWTANDWILSHSGQEAATLKTTQPYQARRFVTDVRLKSDSSTARVMLGDAVTIELGGDTSAQKTASASEPVGKWNRIEAVIEGDRCRVTLNGDTIQQFECEVAARTLQLTAQGDIDFCNVFVATGQRGSKEIGTADRR